MASCDTLYQTPGPRGRSGANGTNGTNGLNAFSTTTAAFSMPAVDATVDVPVDDASWASVTSNGVNGPTVHVQNAGYMRIDGKPDDQTLSLTNLGTDGNIAVGTTIPAGSRIVSAGLPGDTGAAGASGADSTAPFITKVPDSGLSNEFALSTLATGLLRNTAVTGVPTIAVDGTHYLSPATGFIPADVGVSLQAWDPMLDALAALTTVADRMIYFTGANAPVQTTLTAFMRTLLDDATAADARTTLGITTSGYGQLGAVTGVNLNDDDSDNAISISASRYRIDMITVENASTSITTATAGVWTGAGETGTLLAAAQSLAALTASTKFKDLTLESIVASDVRTEASIRFRVKTAQGGAATATVRVFGWVYA